MDWSIVTALISTLSSIILISVVLIIITNEKNKFKDQINAQIQSVVKQINNAQVYEHSSDVQQQQIIDRVQNDIQHSLVLQEQNTNSIMYRQNIQQKQMDTLNKQVNRWKADMGNQLSTLENTVYK